MSVRIRCRITLLVHRYCRRVSPTYVWHSASSKDNRVYKIRTRLSGEPLEIGRDLYDRAASRKISHM